MDSCPPLEALTRLGHDSLDGMAFVALEEHVERCPACQAALEEFARDVPGSTASVPGRGDPPEIPGFLIEGELGRGGMGVVYRAWDAELSRLVALKVVPSGPTAGTREHKRWLREARAVTRVKHPHVVQLHRVGEADGWLYLVLEFVPGGSLDQRLRGPIPARDAAGLLEAVAGAVVAVHQAGLLHLDLKPSNILLDSAPEAPWERAVPKVADFGIARPWANPETSTASLAGPCGTPSYMAPEQVKGDRAAIGPAADVYALGAILYELLTGRPPFQAASLVETLDQIRSREPATPRKLNPSIPRDLETICSTCLEKEPRQRYPTVEALAEDLRRWLDGRPIAARPVSTAEHAGRWCRRRPAIAALLGLLALTLTGSILGLSALLSRSEAEREQAVAARETAEANYRVASDSLSDLAELTDATRKNAVLPDRFLPILETARAHGLQLRMNNPLDLRVRRRLAIVDRLIASQYSRQGRFEDARSLALESISRFEEGLPPGSDDPEVRWLQMEMTGHLAGYYCELKTDFFDDSWIDISASVEDRLRSSRYQVAALMLRARSLRAIADHLARAGERDCSRRILEADLRRLDSLTATESTKSALILCKMLVLAALGRWSGGIEIPGPPAPTTVKAEGEFERGIAELMNRQVGWRPSSFGPTRSIRDDRPESSAESVVASIPSLCVRMGLAPSTAPRIAWLMGLDISFTAAGQRGAGKLEDARRTAAWLHTFADRLVQAYPGQPESYLLLSEAYFQESKVAWKDEDPVAIRRNLEQTVESARRAISLDPENEYARRLFQDRRRRLDALDDDRSHTDQR